MPTHKEWVVDETGFHAKSVFETAPADKTAVYLDDDTTQKTADDNKKQLRLSEGVFFPGSEGFKFIKECKVKVKVELSPDMKNASITFKLYSLYNDGKEDIEYDHKFQVKGDTIDGYAEAVIEKLFYDENYVNDKEKAPDAKCKYFFIASHPKAEKEIPSEYLEMPQENAEEELYGGFELQTDDNDSKKKWGGKQQEKEGKFVEELQEDLFDLGYWISSGLQSTVSYDGDFKMGIYSGLKTFQYEHKESDKLKVTGKLDKETAKLIKKCKDNASFKRPGVSVTLSNTKKFYQLPPSTKYKRYNAANPDYVIKKRSDKSRVKGDLEDVYHNHLWGTKEVIDALIKIVDKWTQETGYNAETDMIEVGDISTWCGGDTRHSTHKDGQGVDIRAKSVGVLNKDEYKTDIDKSVKFAKLAYDNGFGRVVTLCPHVSETINTSDLKYVTLISGHKNHYHLDYASSGNPVLSSHTDRAYCNECKWKDKNNCNSDYKELKENE